MILDDLFEQQPLPAHIKASDLPPAMRKRLTMRDIEQERPRGAYRYRVTPGKPGESPKDFLDLPGAEQYAQATGGRVQPLEEQADPDVQRGIQNLDALERNAANDQPVEIQNETGRAEYQIEKARDKQWVINHAKEWVDAGRTNDLYRYMGNTRGFEFLLAAWQKEDAYRSAQSRREKFEPDADTTPDLYGTQAKGTPRAPRYQDESAGPQKKTSDLEEAPQGARGRTERMISQMRARQPQATSDLEALAYELQDAEKRDAQEIDKLEREVDNLETDVKQELQKRIATLTRRKGGIQQVAAGDTKIDATLDQLSRVNDQQQRDINNLTKAVAGLGQTRSAPIVSPNIAATAATADASKSSVTPRSADQSPAIEIPTTYRSKPKSSVEPETYPGAVTGLIRQLQKPATLTPTGADDKPETAVKVDQPPSDEVIPRDIPKDGIRRIQPVDPDSWKRQRRAESLDEQPTQAPGRFARMTGKAANLAKGAVDIAKTIGGGTLGLKGRSPFDTPRDDWHKYGWAEPPEQLTQPRDRLSRAGRYGSAVKSTRPALKTVPASPAQTPGPVAAPAPTSTSSIIQPRSYSKPRTRQQQMAMQAAKDPVYSQPVGWNANDMWVKGPKGWVDARTKRRTPDAERINALELMLQQTAQSAQNVSEKKKPQPTNPDLWSRAKSAARSKFDVYPSAYANAWAAKWYKSKGGGWRMGKPKKK